MDTSRIKELAEIMAQYGLTELEIEDDGAEIKLRRESAAPAAVSVPVQAPVTADAVVAAEPAGVDFNGIVEVKSPIVGVFYSAPTPESVPFVTIGSKVHKGDVLCIVEAMKLMNEITAEQDGEIVDICIKNGDIVEFGQVLFKMF